MNTIGTDQIMVTFSLLIIILCSEPLSPLHIVSDKEQVFFFFFSTIVIRGYTTSNWAPITQLSSIPASHLLLLTSKIIVVHSEWLYNSNLWEKNRYWPWCLNYFTLHNTFHLIPSMLVYLVWYHSLLCLNNIYSVYTT